MFRSSEITFLLEDKPFSVVNFNFHLNTGLFSQPNLLGSIEIGYLRSGDWVGTDGDGMMVKYQDGTTRKINQSWFE